MCTSGSGHGSLGSEYSPETKPASLHLKPWMVGIFFSFPFGFRPIFSGFLWLVLGSFLFFFRSSPGGKFESWAVGIYWKMVLKFVLVRFLLSKEIKNELSATSS